MSAQTEAQITEWKEAFSLFDKDGDDAIPTSELGTVMRALGACPTQGEIADMIKTSDPKGTKLINFDTFSTLMASKINDKDSEADLIDAFRVFDKEGTGVISAQNLKHTLITLGERMSEAEVDEMLKEAGVPLDGQIKYADFVKTLLA